MAAPSPKKGRPQLWALRSPIPEGTGRLLGVASIALLMAAWCVCSYVTVTRDGKAEPLVSHFFLPAPDQVLRSLLYLIFERDLLGAVWVSIQRILIAFGLSVAIALPLGIAMGSFEVVNRLFDP